MNKAKRTSIEALRTRKVAQNLNSNYGELTIMRNPASLDSYKINVKAYFALNQVGAQEIL